MTLDRLIGIHRWLQELHYEVSAIREELPSSAARDELLPVCSGIAAAQRQLKPLIGQAAIEEQP